jgi:hypothetical protein
MTLAGLLHDNVLPFLQILTVIKYVLEKYNGFCIYAVEYLPAAANPV